MPWIVGIDEAGYGPNLGPFVMSSVACRVPAELAEANLWHVLRRAVRRPGNKEDGRLLVGDSKLVYTPARGLGDLETGVLAALVLAQPTGPSCLREYIDWACPAGHEGLCSESWYLGATALPVTAEPQLVGPSAERFHAVRATMQVSAFRVYCVVVCPTRFNELLDHWGSKGAVLGHSLGTLLAANRDSTMGDEPMRFLVDKHGGRNNYAAMLQHSLPGSMVVAREEKMERSVYQVLGLEREMSFTFQPRADAEHFCVALASMASKYLRELLMLEFNQYWQQHVPNLEPTAGYPGDSTRFFEAIRPAILRLGLPEAVVWRRK